MKSRLTLDAEAAFLLMVARRVLNYQRAAEKDGETYTDMTHHQALQCGIRAKMQFDPSPSGYTLLLVVDPNGQPESKILTAAQELLGGAVEERPLSPTGYRTFQRKP